MAHQPSLHLQEDPKYEGRSLIAVTNYERLKGFNLSKFHAVAIDESGVLKDAESVTASLLVNGCASVPYRLSLRAPPSPDDLDEIINQVDERHWMDLREIVHLLMHSRYHRLFFWESARATASSPST